MSRYSVWVMVQIILDSIESDDNFEDILVKLAYDVVLKAVA